MMHTLLLALLAFTFLFIVLIVERIKIEQARYKIDLLAN